MVGFAKNFRSVEPLTSKIPVDSREGGTKQLGDPAKRGCIRGPRDVEASSAPASDSPRSCVRAENKASRRFSAEDIPESLPQEALLISVTRA